MKRIKLIVLAIFTYLVGKTQSDAPEMADSLRQNGKIYVVVTVIGIIFTGIITYLIYLERKLSKLEKK